MTTTNNIQLTGEKETLFIPLVGKAWDYRSKNSILNDSTASDIVEKTGIGATKHKRTGNKIFAVRAKQYDQWTQYFIAKKKWSHSSSWLWIRCQDHQNKTAFFHKMVRCGLSRSYQLTQKILY